MLKKRLIASVLLLGLLLLPQLALAQQNTLLPEGNEASFEDCETALNDFQGSYNTFMEFDDETRENYLACAIRTGQIHLWMIPYYLTYFIDFFIGLAGIVSVLFVLLGGFWYMTGGLTDDKEKGKKTVTYALMGLALTLLAWLIVNIIQVQVTS